MELAEVQDDNEYSLHHYDVESEYEDIKEIKEIPSSICLEGILPCKSVAPEVQSPELLNAISYKLDNPFMTKKELLESNCLAEKMHAPLLGPLPRFKKTLMTNSHEENLLTGHIEKCVINDIAFDIERNSFQRYGIAIDPSEADKSRLGRLELLSLNTVTFENAIVQDTFKKTTAIHNSLEPVVVSDIAIAPNNNNNQNLDNNSCRPKNIKKQKRKLDSGDDSGEYIGPWAPPLAEQEKRKKLEIECNKLVSAEYAEEQRISSEAAGILLTLEEEKKNLQSSEKSLDAVAEAKKKITSIFHCQNDPKYNNRSWISFDGTYKPRADDQIDQLPKRLIHTYTGHTTGVQAIRFFPKTGHLLLSASLDSKCKMWDVYNQRKCLMTYVNHTEAVKDIQFADEGKKFYSCSYDTKICLWDTEYGKIIGTYTNDKIPYCVSVHPNEGMDHIFIIGSANKKAVQFDAKTGGIVQEYSEHLAAVNTVSFCENGLRIITTADDKKIFVWEFGIPVVVKHIAEPYMHSMPATRLHPSKKFLACQSMDNQILVYEAAGWYRFQGSRRFKGHSNSGYAILPGFSNDGHFIMSGDVSGKLWFWDWKTGKNHRTLVAHDSVCMGSEWHPTMVATCGWDGLIKLWD